MTVLILAPEHDLTADRMVAHLQRREVPAARFDTAWFPQRAHLAATLHDGAWAGTLTFGERCVALDELRSIWYRSPSAFELPPALSPAERHWAAGEAKLGLGGVLSALPVLWVNQPSRVADAAFKPLQLRVAAMCGLAVPETLITNDDTAVRCFAETGETVSKALGAPSIREQNIRMTAFTHVLDDADLDDLRGVEATAHQFQRWVPKDYEARVIVVGAAVFAAGIHAGTSETYVDWRNSYSDLAYSRPCPPESVRDGVVRYCREFGLVYGAFDFVVRPDGCWVFLECNAGGQYGWIEDAIDAPITTALADVLAAGAVP